MANLRQSLTIFGRRGALGSEAGLMLIEVMMATLVLGIASLGLALMFSRGSADVVAMGDDRIALGLAEQKIEQLRAAGFGAATTGTAPPESISSGARTFTRVTCTQYVDPNDPNGMGSPAYSSDCLAGIDTGTNPKRITIVVTAAQAQGNIGAPNAAAQVQGWIFR
jgi:Tfp pilus assembly protein PilV